MAIRTLKKSWMLNEECFKKLLEALDPDGQACAERYEHLRRSLIRYFDWRGSIRAEKDADETIDRVARKLSESHVEDLHSYALGIARNVARESLRARQKEETAAEAVHAASLNTVQDSALENRFRCFEKCLKRLPAEKEALILSYYHGANHTKIRNRRQMAERAGIPLNRLRIQAHRIRETLESCINRCLSRMIDVQ